MKETKKPLFFKITDDVLRNIDIRGGVNALIHDYIIVFGVFVLLRIPLNGNIIDVSIGRQRVPLRSGGK